METHPIPTETVERCTIFAGPFNNTAKANKGEIEKIAANIAKIVKHGILLDTSVSVKSSARKMDGTSWMHSFYSVVRHDGKLTLNKLYAENVYSQKTSFTRAYSLKYIKKIAEFDGGVLTLSDGLTESHSTISINNVSDLFYLVKKCDEDFFTKVLTSRKTLKKFGKPSKTLITLFILTSI